MRDEEEEGDRVRRGAGAMSIGGEDGGDGGDGGGEGDLYRGGVFVSARALDPRGDPLVGEERGVR